MSLFRHLRVRLFLTYLLVITVGALTVLMVVSLLASSFFEGHLGRMGMGPGPMAEMMESGRQELVDAFAASVGTALLVGAGAAVLTAGLAAVLLGRYLLGPLEAVRAATRRLAAGDYREPVPVPSEVELAALARDVNALAQALAATEGRRVRLLSEVAHELRTPLTTIEGYMEGLIDGVLPPTGETYAAVADEAGRLKRLADDLALLSRAEEGVIPLQPEDTDLGEIAARAAERLRPQYDDQEVDLVVDIIGLSLPVRADPDRIAQVFTNLLGNALTHTPSGGTVAVRGGQEDSKAWVEVADTGRGIPPEELERIFERFHRAAGGGAEAGRGIGLTIARSITRAHGGEVTAASQGVGHGATFRVAIPLRRAGNRS